MVIEGFSFSTKKRKNMKAAKQSEVKKKGESSTIAVS
jgi:hypothetical protein